MTRNERKVFRELVFRVVLALDYAKRRGPLEGPMADREFTQSLETAALLVEEAHGLHPRSASQPAPGTPAS